MLPVSMGMANPSFRPPSQLRSCHVVPLALVVAGVLGGEVAGRELPNVVLINADDVGYGDVGAYGAVKVQTPRIDRLAREGRRFTDAHAASAVCSPSRYALLTGAYPCRVNLWAPMFLRDPLIVDTSQMTIGRVMKEAGYATAAIGKWHLGFGRERPVDWNEELKPGPLELGFDYYYGVPVLNSHPPFVYVENHRVVGLTSDDPLVYGRRAQTSEFPEKFGLAEIGGGDRAHQQYVDRQVGTTLKNKAVHWIEEHKNQRFFLYLATTNIHHPFTPDQRFDGSSQAGRYGDFIHELDWIVGEVLDALDRAELTDDTLVIFTSDNGGMLNQGGQDAWKAGHRLNGDLLGFKFDAWEGGHRVPFVARWPGEIPAGSVSNQLLSNVDLLATLAAVVGRELQPAEGPDSENMLPALVSSPASPLRDRLLISPAQKDRVAIRSGPWVYISGQGGGGFADTKIGAHSLGGPAAHLLTNQVNSDIEEGKIKEGAPPAQLYNLQEDPAQATNLYRTEPRVVERMLVLLEEELAACRQGLPAD